MPQTWARILYPSECGGVEQYPRLIAILRDSIPLQIKI